MGHSICPNDLSEYPDYPKKSEYMSLDKYASITKKYWKDRGVKKKQEKKRAERESKFNQILKDLTPKDLSDLNLMFNILVGLRT